MWQWFYISLVAAVGLAVGCADRAPEPEFPDVDREVERIDRRATRLERIRDVMKRDLDELEQLSRTFAERTFDDEGGGESFPLDLFKHVVVDCLNTPATSEPSDASGDTPFGLVCRPQFSDRLESAVANRDGEVRRRIEGLLARVDRFHTLRIQLRDRLAKLGEILDDTRDVVTRQRAALRKRRKRWDKKETEYRRKHWRQVEERFDRIEQRLEDLEKQAEELNGAAKSWPTRVDRANRRMYFSVTELDEPRDFSSKR